MTSVEISATAGVNPAEIHRISSILNARIGAFPAERRVMATLAPTQQRYDEPGIPPDIAAIFKELGKLQTLVTPLVAHDRVVGVFDTWTPFDTVPFTQADIAAATAIGQQAGLAIHNARLLMETRRHATEQAALLRVSQAAVSSLDVEVILAEIAQASLGVANAEACSIEIWDPAKTSRFSQPRRQSTIGPVRQLSATQISFDDWPITRIVLEQQETIKCPRD